VLTVRGQHPLRSLTQAAGVFSLGELHVRRFVRFLLPGTVILGLSARVFTSPGPLRSRRRPHEPFTAHQPFA
jgi:hypothetical protein